MGILYSNSAEYTYNHNYHNSLDIYNYTHSTSPIRRIVDLMNQELFHNDEINDLIFNLHTFITIAK